MGGVLTIVFGAILSCGVPGVKRKDFCSLLQRMMTVVEYKTWLSFVEFCIGHDDRREYRVL